MPVERVHFADAVIVRIGDEEIAGGVDGETEGAVEFRGGGRSAVAGVAPDAVAGYGGDRASEESPRGRSRCRIGDEEIAVGVGCHGIGQIDSAAVAGPPSPQKPAVPLPATVVMIALGMKPLLALAEKSGPSPR